jgi:quercetin dioxygenase-like cupin family protein
MRGPREAADVPDNAPTAAKAAKTRLVLQTGEVRVVEYMLAAGEGLGWHTHSAVSDHIYGLEGDIVVECRAPHRIVHLAPGESVVIPPGTVHRTRNGGEGRARYLLVQGVGPYDFHPVP